MISEQSVTVLREQAMAALRESTTMLEVASNLLDAGNMDEAVRLKDEARAKRNVSVWLMGESEHPGKCKAKGTANPTSRDPR